MGASPASQPMEWHSLAMPKRELFLAFTLPTGQSFRWRKTGDDLYTGVVHQRVVGSVATHGWSYTPCYAAAQRPHWDVSSLGTSTQVTSNAES